ncbi:MAG: autotransporter domain-containing protein, partial [Alphaproteobacteria bacterium]|nr:autotransporter domain-containing protein [Alphaproteobacteria bacterium]
GTTSISADSNLGAASGPLTFNGGTLETTASLTSARNVTLNAFGGTFQIGSGTTTLSGVITGTGDLRKTGVGILDLTGANTYSGGTFLNGGTTSISADSNLGAASGPLTFNGGTLETTASLTSARNVTLNALGGTFQIGSGTTTLSGVITGTGDLRKTGVGILDLTGTNLYTGNTFVTRGAFSLRSALPNSAVFVAPEAFITGTGTMQSLNLSGTISPGNSVGTGSPTGTIAVTDNFTMNPTATYLARVNSDGTSDLITVGGTAQLDGTLTVVTNSPTQSITGQGFTLLTAAQGITGLFTNILTSNRLRLAVQYVGTSLKVIVNSIQNFADEFSPNDKSNSARMARYVDTFADNATQGSDLSRVNQVLDGYLNTGDVAGLTSAFNKIQPSLFREFGFLSFSQATLVNKAVRRQQQYQREAVWAQPLECICPTRVASFNQLVQNQPMKGFLSQNNLSNGGGKPKKKGLNFAQDEGNIKGAPVAQRVRNELTSMWIEPYAQVNDKNRNSHGSTRNGNVGIKSHTSGFSLGGDVQLCKNMFVGLLGGYSNTPFDWRSHRGNGHMHTTNLGVYGTWVKEGFYLDGQIIGGNNRFKSWRKIAFGSINRTARESHRAFQLSTDGEIGYAMALPCFIFQPFINLDYVLVHEKSYREKGAQSLNLNIKSKRAQFLQGELGATIYHTYVVNDVLIRPAFQVGWLQKRPFEHNGSVKGGLVDQPKTLTVIGDNRVRNQFAPAVSLTAQFPNGFNMTANLSAEVFDGQNTGEALLRLGYDF